ncbi:uncharacterized protein N7469_003729 [Penicillium citrinum]|uniref:BRCT domain-containing protein n=1 Tax=Penicillium citrinum TaxID=5077 RepID=A0A9W9TPV6_PENCI|nr:uncharacterized protein N7469_003729 [Penicillium citrinum]KAJ5234561.1 hypothetical protein N7469_003729 [Penicillium citrinum]
MPPAKPKQPHLRNTTFDNWASHSTGHQVADNPYSNTTAWRDTRAEKLSRQYLTGNCLPGFRGEGDCNSSASPGAFDGTIAPDSPETGSGESGSHWGGDGNQTSKIRSGGEYRWVSDAEAKRSRLGVKDIRSFMGVNKRKAEGQSMHLSDKKLRLVNPVGTIEGEMEKRSLSRDSSEPVTRSRSLSGTNQIKPSSTHTTDTEIEAQIPSPDLLMEGGKTDSDTNSTSTHSTSEQTQKQLQPAPKTKSNIFTGTSIYINGTTLPQISDHKLKHLLVANGANVATYMSRKNVTHIIVAQPGTKGSGAGGGLAARKLETEISRGGWKGTKIVGIEWVLESIKAGKRLSEVRFSVLNVASKGQRSVAGYFGG